MTTKVNPLKKLWGYNPQTCEYLFIHDPIKGYTIYQIERIVLFEEWIAELQLFG